MDTLKKKLHEQQLELDNKIASIIAQVQKLEEVKHWQKFSSVGRPPQLKLQHYLYAHHS